MAATLKTIASELNLSINTVSRALRDMPDISPETKRLVRETADLLGYRKNLAASRLRTNKSNSLGLIVTDIANPAFSSIIRGVEEVARTRGYTLMLGNSNEDAETEDAVVSMMLSHGVDGIILVPCMRSEKIISVLDCSGVPYILAVRKFSEIRREVIRNDDPRGAAALAEHLYSLGHRRFLYVAGRWHISSTHERYNGFVSYLQSRGLPDDAVQILSGEGAETDPYRLFCSWLDRFPDGRLPVTAIFSFSDHMVGSIYRALRERGIRVPEDVSVVGYDNNEYSAMLEPPITTVDNHLYDIGRISTHRLFEILDNQNNTEVTSLRETVIMPELVVRESTSRAKE